MRIAISPRLAISNLVTLMIGRSVARYVSGRHCADDTVTSQCGDPRADQVRRLAAAGWVLHLLEQGAFQDRTSLPGCRARQRKQTPALHAFCHIRGWAMPRPAICGLQHEMAIACLAHTKVGVPLAKKPRIVGSQNHPRCAHPQGVVPSSIPSGNRQAR